jgi:hypothetical protein
MRIRGETIRRRAETMCTLAGAIATRNCAIATALALV